jgi:hypothetical protein
MFIWMGDDEWWHSIRSVYLGGRWILVQRT